MQNRRQGTPVNDLRNSSDKSLKLIESILSTEKRKQIPTEDSTCCDEEVLCAYIDDTLARAERSEVEAHLAGCDRCLNEVVALYEVIESIESIDEVAVPDRIREIATMHRTDPKLMGDSAQDRSWWKELRKYLMPRTPYAVGMYAAICLLIVIGGGLFLLDHRPVDFSWQIGSALVAVATLPASPEIFEDLLDPEWLPTGDVTPKGGYAPPVAVRYFRLGVYSAIMTLSSPGNPESGPTEYYRSSFEHVKQEIIDLRLPNTFAQEISILQREPQESTARVQQFDDELGTYLREKKPAYRQDFWFGKWAFTVNLYAAQLRKDVQATFPDQLHALLDPRFIQRFRKHLHEFEWTMRRQVLATLERLESHPRETPNLLEIEKATQRILDLYLLGNRAAIKMLVNLKPRNPRFKVEVWVNKGTDITYQIGEEIRFFFRAEVNCYITLLYIDANGETSLLSPNRVQPDSRVKANQTYTAIPDAIPQFIKVQAPAGTEWVKVIATTDPFSIEAEVQRYFEETPHDFFGALDPAWVTAELHKTDNWATDGLTIEVLLRE